MIDLHMHTNYSDDSRTVEEILRKCEEMKLEYISITDHNTCKQYLDENDENSKEIIKQLLDKIKKLYKSD